MKTLRSADASTPTRSLRMQLLIAFVLAVGGLSLGGATAPASGAARAQALALYVNFAIDGTITVTLANGHQIGVTSGQPQEIPAGAYTVYFIGPSDDCTPVPFFALNGPGVDISSNLPQTTNTANLVPNSTYTWTDDAFPSVHYTFTTSAIVEHAAPTVLKPVAPGIKGVSYPSIVGSDLVPFRGKLTATLNKSAKISLSFRGKRPKTLAPGKYTIAVTDRSTQAGLTLAHAGHASTAITGAAFIGTRTKTVNLTAGTWQFGPAPNPAQYSILVS